MRSLPCTSRRRERGWQLRGDRVSAVALTLAAFAARVQTCVPSTPGRSAQHPAPKAPEPQAGAAGHANERRAHRPAHRDRPVSGRASVPGGSALCGGWPGSSAPPSCSRCRQRWRLGRFRRWLSSHRGRRSRPCLERAVRHGVYGWRRSAWTGSWAVPACGVQPFRSDPAATALPAWRTGDRSTGGVAPDRHPGGLLPAAGARGFGRLGIRC